MGFSNIRRMLIGAPFPTSHESHERLDKVRALAIFASDPISSNAYATEAIMSVLIVMGSGALSITYRSAWLWQRWSCLLFSVIFKPSSIILMAAVPTWFRKTTSVNCPHWLLPPPC